MTMNITANEAREAIEKELQYIEHNKKKIEKNVKDMEKCIKKGDWTQAKAHTNFINLYFKCIKETEERIELLEFEMKKAEAVETEGQGWQVVIDFLQEMFEDDMEWWKKLKKLTREELKHETKSTQVIADMNEKDAQKLFRRDLHIRFIKLVKAVKAKAGENVSELNLERNPNGGLDGIVVGDKKTVRLETIIAGGYNIQRAHYRTLVK